MHSKWEGEAPAEPFLSTCFSKAQQELRPPDKIKQILDARSYVQTPSLTIDNKNITYVNTNVKSKTYIQIVSCYQIYISQSNIVENNMERKVMKETINQNLIKINLKPMQ